jgi:hypothetical protein
MSGVSPSPDRSTSPVTSIAQESAMTLDDIISLAQAADELNLGTSTLRHQAAGGRLEARLVGKTWITTRQEVERYRREHLGRPGRPANHLLEQRRDR